MQQQTKHVDKNVKSQMDQMAKCASNSSCLQTCPCYIIPTRTTLLQVALDKSVR